MSRESWRNPYIDKVAQEGTHIFACRNNEVPAEEKKRFEEIRQDFERLYCEIGSGSGGHLIERAARDPQGLYLGIELRFKRTFRTAEKAAERGLRNLFVARTRAQLLPELFEKNTLSGVYILFPDPWDKDKWKKHRIFQPAFLDTLLELLKDNAFIHYKTDHHERFEEALALFNNFPQFTVTKQSFDLHNSRWNTANIESEFEKLFTSKGLPIYFLEVQKSPQLVQTAL